MAQFRFNAPPPYSPSKFPRATDPPPRPSYPLSISFAPPVAQLPLCADIPGRRLHRPVCALQPQPKDLRPEAPRLISRNLPIWAEHILAQRIYRHTGLRMRPACEQSDALLARVQGGVAHPPGWERQCPLEGPQVLRPLLPNPQHPQPGMGKRAAYGKEGPQTVYPVKLTMGGVRAVQVGV